MKITKWYPVISDKGDSYIDLRLREERLDIRLNRNDCIIVHLDDRAIPQMITILQHLSAKKSKK